MELAKDKAKIKKWGNAKGVLLPKKTLITANLENKEDITITVEVNEVGKKRIIIEEETADYETLLDDLVGTVELPADFNLKQARTDRKQGRLEKHEIHY
ncbi:AbrB/MazE/SpoVT family DNA-binding domain-containing protein [Enterococcus sp. AZ109]|uniref:AbrB/MazE/SpoVT family DNA-binding domain-containing protein n=1 Tax=Enterococcus sp. AZ109 TaxID=2774634 RepID=UPI003F29C2F6